MHYKSPEFFFHWNIIVFSISHLLIDVYSHSHLHQVDGHTHRTQQRPWAHSLPHPVRWSWCLALRGWCDLVNADPPDAPEDLIASPGIQNTQWLVGVNKFICVTRINFFVVYVTKWSNIASCMELLIHHNSLIWVRWPVIAFSYIPFCRCNFMWCCLTCAPKKMHKTSYFRIYFWNESWLQEMTYVDQTSILSTYFILAHIIVSW